MNGDAVVRPLTAPVRDEVDDVDLPAYDQAFTYWGAMFAPDATPEELGRANPWAAALLHSPRFAIHRAELSTLLRTAPDRPGSFSHAEREWVGMVLAAHLGTFGVAAIHAPEAIRVGVRVEAIEAVMAASEDSLTPVEQLTAEYIRQVIDGRVADSTFDALAEHLGRRGIVEYTYYITMIWTVIRQYQAFGGAEADKIQVLALARSAAEVSA